MLGESGGAECSAVGRLLEALFDRGDMDTVFDADRVLSVLAGSGTEGCETVAALAAAAAGAEVGHAAVAEAGSVAVGAFHGVVTAVAHHDTSVERREKRVDVELGQWQVGNQVKRVGEGEEEDDVDDGKHTGEQTSLESTTNETGDDVVGGSETGAALVEGPDEAASDEDVGHGCADEPDDDDDLELLELGELLDDLDTNGAANGAQEAGGTEGDDHDWEDPAVGELANTPGEEALGGERNDTGHRGVGRKGRVGNVHEDLVAKVGNDIVVEHDRVKDRVERVGDHEEGDKHLHEGLVLLEVAEVDVRLHARESVEPDIEDDADEDRADARRRAQPGGGCQRRHAPGGCVVRTHASQG